VLYGVTMGPDGASQVVSARMAEEEIEREAREAGGRGGQRRAAVAGTREDGEAGARDDDGADAPGTVAGADGPAENETDDGAR